MESFKSEGNSSYNDKNEFSDGKDVLQSPGRGRKYKYGGAPWHDDDDGRPPAGGKQRLSLIPAQGYDQRPRELPVKHYVQKNGRLTENGPTRKWDRDDRDETRGKPYDKQKRDLRTPSREPRRRDERQAPVPDDYGREERRAQRCRPDEQSRRGARVDLLPREHAVQRTHHQPIHNHNQCVGGWCRDAGPHGHATLVKPGGGG